MSVILSDRVSDTMMGPQPCILVEGRRYKHYMGRDMSLAAPLTDEVEVIGTSCIVPGNYWFVLGANARITLISNRTQRGAALKKPTVA